MSMEEVCEKTTDDSKKLGNEGDVKKMWKRAANLIFCGGGSVICYFWFGIVHESM